MTGISNLVTIYDSLSLLKTATERANLYFAYGSNMNAAQMKMRTSAARVVATACLPDYRLGFFGHTEIWDSAIETVEPCAGSSVWGVVYSLSSLDWERLDLWQDARMDGAGSYFHYPIRVVDEAGRGFEVRMYKKDIQGSPLTPSVEYLGFIAHGAMEKGLPSSYVEELRQRPTHQARYMVPLRPGYDLGKSAGVSCADYASGA